MARNDPPRDLYAVALDISLVAADRVQRTVMRRDVVLERARLSARRAEAELIAMKYNDKQRDAEAHEAVRLQADRFTNAFDVAERTYIEPFEVGADEVVIHGVVRGTKGHKLDVHVLGPGDKSVAHATTDEHGHFKISSATAHTHAAATSSRLPVVGDNPTTDARLRLSVRTNDKELYRDKETFAVRPGRAVYRQLDVEVNER